MLTEEQKKQIEENRRKALERRAAFLKSRESIEASSSHVNTSEKSNLAKIFLKKDVNTRQNGESVFHSNKPSSSYKNTNHKPLSTKNFYKRNNAECSGEKFSFSGKPITGNFLLVNTERFSVNIPYNTESIEIFKTIPSKQYDALTKKWSFDINHHRSLADALDPLRPKVCVSPLPNFVLEALKNAAAYSSPANVDLMSVDPLLLEAFMPFQREGVCFGVSRKGRVLIADDMGLGKTIQALGIASYYRREWPLLIVCPSSVRYGWLDSFSKWISTVDREDISVVDTGKDMIEGSAVIMSYDMLSKRLNELKNINFQVVIMDESHMLKNFKSNRYKAASTVMRKAKRVILLSGTPALSRPSELYTQLSAIDRSLFPKFQDYGIRYCGGKQLAWGWDFSGSSNMEELNVILEASLMIRRMKADVISQLPAKQRMTVILDSSSIRASEKRMKEAAEHLNEVGLKGTAKQSALLQFFNETALAKSDAVCDYVKELLTEGNKKFLIFAHHKIMMDKISSVCNRLKTKYIRIDGTTPSESRQELVERFQEDAEIRVAVLSVTAANTGITLTAAQLVVFAELYWNPGLLVQAEDRAHRIGQVDSVLVQYLVAKETADDIIWPLIEAKLNILNKVGLSKESFLSAETANQKGKAVNEQGGIKRYFSEIKTGDDLFDITDEEMIECCLESPLLKRKKSEHVPRENDD